ncbi:MAG: DUF3455 domain-containing protein [Bryobacteraceae bacterium]|nr:DUF3455 domain-containing protein [Bryobacteraceae bacterium]
MSHHLLRLIAANAIVFSLPSAAMDRAAKMTVPSMPPELQVPAGNTLYLKGYAVGTQNYVCSPGAGGPAWRFLGPQATLFLTIPWIQGEIRQQIATHFLSSNPAEAGTARPVWQHSLDTSAVWGRVKASSTDPNFVAAGAIPWLLLEAAGARRGPIGGSALVQTTYIQRLNTSGGVAPTSGCNEPAYGMVVLVPYTTDYFFYRDARR